MSGHSKWATIKRKKASADAKRGQAFTRLAKEITIAAREGPDPDVNFRLRLAVDKARAENMPKENIERAIRRGAGLDKDAAALEEVMYEGYGPHGIAFLVSVVTDNRNRSLADIRRAFNRAGGSMGAAGSVAWQFEQKSYFSLETEGRDHDTLFDIAVESGADDVVFSDNMVEIYAEPSDFQIIREGLQLRGLKIDTAELTMVPKTTVSLDEKQAFQNMTLISSLEEIDDVQDVYSNLDITDELMAKYEEQE
ncbi:MAG: YebC/PmpR family DNA-binding transcriptional regulator [Anaerolineaceae bacterium]|nr:YebC/PmpR family DNA-binding transcriptional regulator [Anaerolineae bacterium]MDX9829919.1 YebC/PmpR family DNA-binding transcriptional regulator [Anaerolineae bacterium]NLF12455.1 YebC/PmpR family DNA-binding transcriptional regulator [Anaerolineaceae bacterium]